MIAAAAVSAAIQGILRLPAQPQHDQYPEQGNTSQDSSYSSSLLEQRTSYDSSYDMDSEELGAVGRDYSRVEESSSYHSEGSVAESYSGSRGAESLLSDHHSSAQQYMENLYQNLHHITHIDTDCLKECHRQIEIWTQNNGESPSTSGTPTEVQDIDF
ncbi:unnamed protein product [Meganyctiphanes norvegica]|uniref:Uncharacterized protein n=1 Tax=Meganyctiphanes norvegica TaxID=48144 RepID=A0AAV2R9C4_MEGNR